jgi:sugar phosphate isomerase/epimerase
MTELKDTQSTSISRRAFCRSAIAAAAAIQSAGPWAQASQTKTRARFYKNLGGGHIGVRANQGQALQYAVEYGFDSITPNLGEFHDKSDSEISEWVALMKEKGVRYGSAGLPVNFRRGREQFEDDLKQLPKRAQTLRQMSVIRTATWILPGHQELTYLQHFEMLRNRFRETAKVLKDNGLSLGLEFVGPRTSRMRFRFPFICTQIGMMELADAIGTGNVGLLLDSWHWYTSHGTVEELMQLSGKDTIHVHVNDAPAGIDVDKQIDSRRQLPVTSGVIDMKGFINALVKIGYDGPVECEPFDQELRRLDNEAALQKTINALDRVWSLIEA